MFKLWSSSLLFIILFAQCQNSDNSSFGIEDSKAEFPEAEMAVSYKSNNNGNKEEQQVLESNISPKIIKSASLKFEVKDIKHSTKSIQQTIEQQGGYVSNMNQHSSSYNISNEITIKIPSKFFDKALEDLEKKSIRTDRKNISTQDVSAEFVDIQTRLKTKREVRDRYVDVLRNKASNVEEIIQAEEAIRNLQEEIEAKEGRLKYLTHQVSLSTITLSIYQEIEETEQLFKEDSFFDKAINKFSFGWSLIKGIALGLIAIWPILLTALIVIWKGKSIYKFFKK